MQQRRFGGYEPEGDGYDWVREGGWGAGLEAAGRRKTIDDDSEVIVLIIMTLLCKTVLSDLCYDRMGTACSSVCQECA